MVGKLNKCLHKRHEPSQDESQDKSQAKRQDKSQALHRAKPSTKTRAKRREDKTKIDKYIKTNLDNVSAGGQAWQASCLLAFALVREGEEAQV